MINSSYFCWDCIPLQNLHWLNKYEKNHYNYKYGRKSTITITVGFFFSKNSIYSCNFLITQRRWVYPFSKTISMIGFFKKSSNSNGMEGTNSTGTGHRRHRQDTFYQLYNSQESGTSVALVLTCMSHSISKWHV